MGMVFLVAMRMRAHSGNSGHFHFAKGTHNQRGIRRLWNGRFCGLVRATGGHGRVPGKSYKTEFFSCTMFTRQNAPPTRYRLETGIAASYCEMVEALASQRHLEGAVVGPTLACAAA